MFKNKYNNDGLMLIELLIVMTMSVFILLALMSVYITAQKNQFIETELLRTTENAVIASRILQTNLASAGYISCQASHNQPLFHAIIGGYFHNSEFITLRRMSLAVNQLEEITYFVKLTPRKTHALYQKDIKNNVTELVDGIDKIEFYYDTDDSAQLLKAKDISNWSHVRGVKTVLTLSHQFLPQKKWYSYNRRITCINKKA